MLDIDIAHLTDRFMRRIHAAMGTIAPHYDTHNLGPAGGILLLTLAEIAPARMQDLVRAMARDKSQITRNIKALEAKGLVEKSGDPDDARACILALTASGQAAARDLQQAVAVVLTDILSPLSPEEQETLRTLLRRI